MHTYTQIQTHTSTVIAHSLTVESDTSRRGGHIRREASCAPRDAIHDPEEVQQQKKKRMRRRRRRARPANDETDLVRVSDTTMATDPNLLTAESPLSTRPSLCPSLPYTASLSLSLSLSFLPPLRIRKQTNIHNTNTDHAYSGMAERLSFAGACSKCARAS